MDTAIQANKTDEAFAMPAYDPAMDPLTVGAQFSRKIHDTLNMKLFEVMVKPGDSIALHTHPDHAIYFIQGGKLAVNIQGVGPIVMDVKPGMGWIGGPVTDYGKNIGNTVVKWVETDVYRPRGK